MQNRIEKIDHVGIVVRDLDEAIRLYTRLFCVGPASVADVPEQKVRTAFFRAGESNIELLCPTSDDSPIAKFLERRGGGIHHICVCVANIEATLADLASQGVRLIDETPRVGAHGERIAFVHPKSFAGVLIELSESSQDPTCAPHPHVPHKGPGSP
ncbi:MAG: methylmalonyl-CoA epimerase [Candidatus Latescibacterota bacterium]|nr:MAG: methylmalonyl-CoA epimerase [Candidatus Latescibacterota bacterium]